MKRSILRAFALCLTTVFLTGSAWAQDDSTTSKSRSGRSGSTSQSGSSPSSGIYGTASSYTSRAGQPVRLSQLMHTSLKSQSGESLGQVQDIVIDPTSGQIQFAVLSLNSSGTGAPGTSTSTTTGTSTGTSTTPGASTTTSTTTGGQLVALPWRLITSSGQGQFTASVDRSTLQSAPTFSSSSWPTMDSTWMQGVYSHFGVSPSSTGAPGTSSGTGTSTGTGTGTGLGNPSTPGVPSTPGTPDINPPRSTTPSTTPGTGTGTGGTGTGSGTGTGTGGAGGAK